MSDDQPKRPVSDISHLFLSNVRDLTGNGMPRPQRKPPPGQVPPGQVPPGQAQVDASPDQAPGAARSQQAAGPHGLHARSSEARVPSVDLTPEEFAHVFGPAPASRGQTSDRAWAADEPLADAVLVAPVTALLASHLGTRQTERVREYARHLAGSVGRVGLIELDGSEFRLSCFEPYTEPGAEIEARQAGITGRCDPREIADALEELNVDVDRWLLLPANLRTPQAKALVRDCGQWVLLTTCDHDGVVSAYRTLKGVTDCRVAADNDGDGEETRLSVAVLDAAGDAEAARIQQKLAGVCRQFIDWDADAEPPVRYAAGVAEHPLMNCRVALDGSQAGGAPHWEVVADLVARAARAGRDVAAAQGPGDAAARVARPVAPAAVMATSAEASAAAAEPTVRRIEVRDEPVVPTPDVVVTPAPAAWVTPPPAEVRPEVRMAGATPQAAPPATGEPRATGVPLMSIAAAARPATDEVIELPGEGFDAPGILAAVVRRREFGMVECPVGVPGCPAGRLAVTRDGGLALVAAASRGLPELRAIGKAFQWMLENRALVAMAVPQFAIDAARPPRIVLLVDQADISADLLAPMMQAEHVTVRAYRTLRWGGRAGLLLDAA